MAWRTSDSRMLLVGSLALALIGYILVDSARSQESARGQRASLEGSSEEVSRG